MRELPDPSLRPIRRGWFGAGLVKPASVDDCYCTACPVALMTSEECATNQAAWKLHCADWAPDPACPVPRCINEPALVCDAGVCVEDPEACRADGDCVRCNQSVAPTSADDCE